MRRIVRVLAWATGIGIVGYLCFCVGGVLYQEMRPTATEQILRFAGLPEDTVLATKNDAQYSPFGDIDYTPIEQALTQQVPLGTPRADVAAFVQARGATCTDEEQAITCKFQSQHFPCTSTATLVWSLTSQGSLESINGSSYSACL